MALRGKNRVDLSQTHTTTLLTLPFVCFLKKCVCVVRNVTVCVCVFVYVVRCVHVVKCYSEDDQFNIFIVSGVL